MKFNNNNNLKQINRFHFLNKTDMKQIFFVMSILLTLQLSAQTLKVPKFTKIVKVIAKDVNLREAPSASSPRLIRSVGEGCEYSIGWSNDPLGEYDAAIRAEALPVVGEAGDWYKAIHNEEGLEFTVYIKKEFCKEVKRRALRLPVPEYMGECYEFTQGKYKGYVLNWGYGWEDVLELRIGKFYDGMLVFTHMNEFDKDYGETGKNIFLDSNGSFTISPKFFKGEYAQLDLNKIVANSAVVDFIMSNVDKMTKVNKGYYGIEGDSNWYTIDCNGSESEEDAQNGAVEDDTKTLRIPKFTKIVELLSTGVNLRKEPNTASPRLVGWFMGDKNKLKNGGIIEDPSTFRLNFAWEGEPGVKGQPAHAKYLLVVSETDEWYYGCPLINNLEVAQASHKLVYVSKKVCKVKQPALLSASYFEDYNEFTSGKYKGFSCFCDPVESSFYETLFMGRIEKGVGFGWSLHGSLLDEDYEQLNNAPDNFVQEQNKNKISIIIGAKIKYLDNHGIPFDTVDGIVSYEFYPYEYEGEAVSY